jgi:hypothetical protein
MPSALKLGITEAECLERLFTPTKQEAYVSKRLKEDHGATVDLDATSSVRRDRIRLAICDYELHDQVCLTNRAGEQMTYGEVFNEMYGEPL